MFEQKTFSNILKDLMLYVPDTYDKREGSVIYDALAPAAAELTAMYIDLDAVIDQTFADTADLGYLKKRAAERGISQIQATNAILQAAMTPSSLDVPIGSRFNHEVINYVVTEKISAGQYKIECETAGSAGNLSSGQLIPINYIAGLETANITAVLVAARDAETTEELRTRYYDSLNSQAFGGNIADYKAKTKNINGAAVAGVKVTPVWSGGGTVKLTILDGSWKAPSAELISAVQNAIDPVTGGGTGLGIAPIGHVVTVVGAADLTVNITCTITYETGHSWSDVGPAIKAAIDEYFLTLSKGWEDAEYLIVRIAQVESRILSCQGVVDVTGTTLNGSATNLSLTSSQIPKRGTINGNT